MTLREQYQKETGLSPEDSTRSVFSSSEGRYRPLTHEYAIWLESKINHKDEFFDYSCFFCNETLTQVRSGKTQCDNPQCRSNLPPSTIQKGNNYKPHKPKV